MAGVRLLLALALALGALSASARVQDATPPALDGPTATATVAQPGATSEATAAGTPTASATLAAAAVASATSAATAYETGTPSATAAAIPTGTATPTVFPTGTRKAAVRLTGTPTPARIGWGIRAVDSMKLSRDTLKLQLSDAQIAAVVRLDARLHLTHVSVDVYFDDPLYLGRWVRAVRKLGLKVWFRGHWYGWEDHRERRGDLTPDLYIEATRRFLQEHATLLENGDIFDFCSEPENGAYWLRAFGNGWSWRNPAAKTAFNSFIRSGLYMASTTLGNRGRGGVLTTAISVNYSIATRMLSKPTVARLGMITLDLYPEGTTRDPATATRRLLGEIAQVRRRWLVPILLGEHGYARDMQVDDATQARVLAAELTALATLPYLLGINYWVDAGGPGYGGYTNLYRKAGAAWQPRPSAEVLARAYAAMTVPPTPPAKPR